MGDKFCYLKNPRVDNNNIVEHPVLIKPGVSVFTGVRDVVMML